MQVLTWAGRPLRRKGSPQPSQMQKPEAWSRGLVDSHRASLPFQGDRPSDVVLQFGLCKEARATSGALEGEKGKIGWDRVRRGKKMEGDSGYDRGVGLGGERC